MYSRLPTVRWNIKTNLPHLDSHSKMMWRLVILLGIALSVDSYGIHERDEHERLTHGRQLKIYLPKNVALLEFTPAGSWQATVLWEEKDWNHHRGRGRVTGDGSDRRWYLDKVTFEDEGTYTRKDFWNKEISTVKVAIAARSVYSKCIAGESLKVDLEGLRLEDANLDFSSEAGNFTLVRDGATVSQDLADYFDRVKSYSHYIEIRHVNTSDEGRYYLKDRKARLVSVTRMDLTDHHEGLGGNPLMALLLLLGIPAGICCCCRKKIFKQKSATTTSTTHTVIQSGGEMVHPDPHGPGGPPPDYSTPGGPGAMYYHGGPDPNVTGPMVHPPPGGQGQWNGPPPSPGFNPAYPPQNPAYPPAGPAMYAPAQPPQWNGPPPGQYGPGPGAPMAAPVQYSAPPPTASEPVKEELKMDNVASSPTDPLLSAPKPEGSPAAPTDEAYTFQISSTTSTTSTTTTNFL